jgi:protein O-GlcNAc transferase
MGVPVVTLAGQTHVSRVSGGILVRVGLARYVATTPDEYIELAMGAAGDLSALAELRKGLRRRFCLSTVFGGQRLVREMEKAYRQMWRRQLDSLSAVNGLTG